MLKLYHQHNQDETHIFFKSIKTYGTCGLKFQHCKALAIMALITNNKHCVIRITQSGLME